MFNFLMSSIPPCYACDPSKKRVRPSSPIISSCEVVFFPRLSVTAWGWRNSYQLVTACSQLEELTGNQSSCTYQARDRKVHRYYHTSPILYLRRPITRIFQLCPFPRCRLHDPPTAQILVAYVCEIAKDPKDAWKPFFEEQCSERGS